MLSENYNLWFTSHYLLRIITVSWTTTTAMNVNSYENFDVELDFLRYVNNLVHSFIIYFKMNDT